MRRRRAAAHHERQQVQQRPGRIALRHIGLSLCEVMEGAPLGLVIQAKPPINR